MVCIVEHLSVEDLGRRYRAAEDATEARHVQAIWLLAQGRAVLEVADPRIKSAGKLCSRSRHAGSSS